MEAPKIQGTDLEAAAREAEMLLSELPKEIGGTWERTYGDTPDAELPSFLTKLKAFVSERNKALRTEAPRAFKEGSRHLATDPNLIEETITRIADLEGRPEYFIGEGNTAHVYGDPYSPGICHKFIRDMGSYQAWNSVAKEAAFLEELEGFEVDGVRTPLLHSLIDRPDIKVIDMERLDGQSLDQIMIRKQSLPQGFDVDTFFERLGRYIQEMHKRFSIYHRDLHEGNIFMGRDGTPYVIDFGRAVRSFNEDWAYEATDRVGANRIFLRTDEERLAAVKRMMLAYVHEKETPLREIKN